MSEHLPDTTFEQLPLSAKRRIDATCARFEQACREGKPRIESFLSDVASEERGVLFTELLMLEVEYRRRAGENPRASDYLERFPQMESLIREALPPTSKSDTAASRDSGHTLRAVLAPAKRPTQVPGYELLEEIGRGGMGVVYKARHLALNRMVALKFILAGTNAPTKHLQRFRREAEVVARLRHPNIVQIYDIGEVENQAFLALEYAEGGNLRDRLGGQPLEPRAAALLLEPLARAVQHAHRQGIVHRDLKPANVLLAVGGDSIASGNPQLPEFRPKNPELPRFSDYKPPLAACTPKITDFGLARMLDAEQSGSELGVAAGTPQYMAPEQAFGDPEAGPLVDVWALGASLYELLTGRPPFRAASARETLRLIVETEPVPPTQLQPSVPRDLETICLKCLEKEPARRYPGARELAQDLRRFLDGEAIHARRIGPMERLTKWARRRPFRAMGCAALFTALLGGLILAIVVASSGYAQWREAQHRVEASNDIIAQATVNAENAELKRATAEASQLEAQLQAARLLLVQAQTQGRLGHPDRAVHDLLTGLKLCGDEPTLSRNLRDNLARWLPYVHSVQQVIPSISPEASFVGVGPDGLLYVGTRQGEVVRQSAQEVEPSRFCKTNYPIEFLAFNPEGTQVLLGGKRNVSLWDLTKKVELCRWGSVLGVINAAIFAADGRSIFTGGEDGIVRRWGLDGKPIGGNLVHPLPVQQMAFDPEGRSLAVALGKQSGGMGSVWLWRFGDDVTQTHAFPHFASVLSIVFHPDGKRIFTGSTDGQAREWSIATANELGSTFDHGGEIVRLGITPDGRTLLTASREEEVRLWEVPSRQSIGTFSGAKPFSHFTRNGEQIVEVRSEEVRFRALARPISRLAGLTPKVHLTPSPIREVSLAGSELRARFARTLRTLPGARIWDRDFSAQGAIHEPWTLQLQDVTALRVHLKGTLAVVASASQDAGTIQLWDPITAKAKRSPWRTSSSVSALAISPDGQEIAAGFHDGSIRRWKVQTGEALSSWSVRDTIVSALTYAPDGRALAVALKRSSNGSEIRWWSLPSERPGTQSILRAGDVESLIYDDEGKTMLVVGDTAELIALESETRIELKVRGATIGRIFAKNKMVLIGTRLGQVHRFDLRGIPLGTPVMHPSAIQAFDLLPDKRSLLIAGKDGTLAAWELDDTPRPLGPPMVSATPLVAIRWSDEGRSCRTLSSRGEVRTWPFPAIASSVSLEVLERQVLVSTGSMINDSGRLVPITPEAWRIRRSNPGVARGRQSPTLDPKVARGRQSPTLADVEEDEPLSAATWHDARSRDARVDGDLFGERWHLDRLLKLVPGDGEARRRRSVVLARIGEFAQAEQDLRAGGSLSLELAWAIADCESLGAYEAARWFRARLP